MTESIEALIARYLESRALLVEATQRLNQIENSLAICANKLASKQWVSLSVAGVISRNFGSSTPMTEDDWPVTFEEFRSALQAYREAQTATMNVYNSIPPEQRSGLAPLP